MKTKDIIKILPIDESLRTSLLEEFDSLDVEPKYRLIELLWEIYDGLFGLKLEENTQLALLRAKEGQETLDKNFYKRVKEQTEKDMETKAIEDVQNTDIASARKALEVIVKEIRASKKQPSVN